MALDPMEYAERHNERAGDEAALGPEE